jgi:protein-disulfide isomerase
MAAGGQKDIPRQPSVYLIPLSIVIAGAMIAGAIVYTDRSIDSNQGARSESAPTAKPEPKAGTGSAAESPDKRVSASADDDPVLGNPNAPVTIIEFSDFRCGFCRKFFTDTLPVIKAKYIDTGKAKLVFRDQPVLGQQSQWAAEAAECANEQGKFWPFHDHLYQNPSPGSQRDDLKKVAEDLKLNIKRFNECFDSNKFGSEVQKDLLDGQNVGVTGTPSFVINGRFVVGAKPAEFFQKVIEEELAAKGIKG